MLYYLPVSKTNLVRKSNTLSMKKHVVIFEARGGSDKGKYGFRKDSKPIIIIDSFKERG